MVQILIVNAYGPGKKGASYQLAVRSLSKLVKGSHFIERDTDDLVDFILDWEHEVLDENSKSIVKHFDKLEMVVIVGDSSLLPWDPKCHQLVTLIHMCHYVERPILALGSGPFHCMYTLCTKGARYDFINGPLGDRITRLPLCNRYAVGSETHPSGWLDSETGDVYSYDPSRKSWKPVCNVGINRTPTHGQPRSGEMLPIDKKYGSDTRLLNEQEKVEAVLRDGEEVANVRNSATWHYSFKKVDVSKFVMKTPAEWHLNSEGAMPTEEGITVLADGKIGPVILSYGNNLLITAEMDRGKSYEIMKQVIFNFVETMLGKIGAVKSEKDERQLLMHRLFGTGKSDDKIWQPIPSEMIKITPTMAASLVPSALSKGPMKVSPRFGDEILKSDRQLSPRTSAMANNVVHVTGTADGYDYHVLRSHRAHDTRGKQTPVASKNLNRVRMKRLDIFLEAQGHPEMQIVNKKAFKLAEKYRQDPDNINKEPSMKGYKPHSAREFYGQKNLVAPKRQEAPVAVRFDPYNATVPKIDFTRPHTAQNSRWHPSKKENEKGDHGQAKTKNRAASSGGWMNSMRNTDLYEHNPVNNDALPRANTQPHPGKRRVKSDLADHFIPESHPDLNRFRKPDGVKGTTEPVKEGNNTEQETDGLVGVTEFTKGHREIMLHSVKKPFNNIEKYSKLEELDKLEQTMDFKGTYTDVYRSEHEKQIHEYNEAKKRFIGPPFRTQFGKASQIPLRAAAVIGSDGKYPDRPKGMAPMAVDWNLFLSNGPDPVGPKWR